METRRIKIADIVPNDGRIPGLPVNPRQWTKTELSNLKKSIQETPELLDARGVIVVPHDDKFVVLGGNMRLTASRELKMKDVPCIVVPADTPVEKMKEIVIKDNGSFGSWDFDALANEWDDLPLSDWGVPAWDTPTEPDDEIIPDDLDAEPGDEKENVVKITFPDIDSLNRFMDMYQEELRTTYDCVLSVSGGKK